MKVPLSQTVGVASIQMDQISCQRAIADGFHDESAGKMTAFSHHTSQLWYCLDTLREYGENCLLADKFLAEWTLKASGHFEADSVFLI